MIKRSLSAFVFIIFISLKLSAASYSFPNDLPGLGCNLWFGTTYLCTGNLTFHNNDNIDVTSSIKISSGASFTANNGLTITTNGNTLDMTLGGVFKIKNNLNASSCINITAGGGVTIGKNGHIEGDLSSSSSVTLGNGTVNTPCGGAAIDPIANYQMDECYWDGTTDEVKDSSGNNYNGTNQKGSSSAFAKTVDTGVLQRNGEFDGGQYIELPNFPNMNSSFTITAWFKSTNVSKRGQRIFADDENNNKGYALSLGDPGSGKLRFYDRSLSPISLDTGSVIENNKWYFASAVMDTDDKTKDLYVYDATGSQVAHVSASYSGTMRTDGGVASIGGETDNGERGNRFIGNIDEVKVFDTALSDAQIEDIYNNEKDGKNYDGTDRAAPCCCLPSNGNLVANPSFETLCESNIIRTYNNVAGGTVHFRSGVCGWNLASGAEGLETWENTTQKPASDGTVFVEIDGDRNQVDSIWQMVDSVEDKEYTIKFDYRKRDNNHKDDIVVKWNDVAVLNIPDSDTSESQWQTGTIYVVGTGSKDKLSFEEPASADDGYGSWVDNIRVVEGGPAEVLVSSFDAWDTFRDINDRNISTKIVSQDFNLTLAALNETNDAYQEFNGTVCTQINGTNSWVKSVFQDQNTTTVGFGVPSAMRDTTIIIVWKKDVDESCPLSNEDNRTRSTDNFAIRPEKFAIISPTATLHAGGDFNLTFEALNANDANSTDYNETRNTSFEVDANVTNANCNLGNFTLNDFTFTNGQKEDVNASYSEVADLNVTIQEKIGSEYAKVDADDTPDAQRLIESNSTILSFRPYQFTIINYAFTRNNPDANWRYMADVNESNITISYNIQAQNEQNQTTQNFDAQCAAENVSTKIDFNISDYNSSDDVNASYFEDINNIQASGNDKNLSNIDFNGTVRDNNFTDGNSSDIIYTLNVYRRYNTPVNPLTITVTDINTTTTDVKNIGLSPENNNSKFYYARLYTQDLSTSKTSDTVQAKVLVYDSLADNYISNLTEELSNWYYYTPQNNASNGNIIGLNVSKTTSKKSANDDGINAIPTFNGSGTFDINVTNPNENTQTHYIHLDVSPWIWYVYKNFGSDYNESVGSSCSEHPCIKYNYHNTNEGSGVSSGHVNGVKFDVNVSKNSRGIRLLR